jgi:hypothetical protein
MTYEEIIELANTSLENAIKETRINMENVPGEGSWVGLYAELVERREVA